MSEQTRLYEEPVRPEDRRLLELAERVIPEGREKAVSRDELARRLGLSDRQARAFVEDCRRAGVLIVNAQDGRGYYRADGDDVESVLRQLRQDEARAKSILVRQKHARRWLAERGVAV